MKSTIMKFVVNQGVLALFIMTALTLSFAVGARSQMKQSMETLNLLVDARLAEIEDLSKIVKDSNTVIKSLVEVNRNVRETLDVAQEIEPKYEKRVLENLKKDYGCPNEHFNDFCMSLENYEHNRRRF